MIPHKRFFMKKTLPFFLIVFALGMAGIPVTVLAEAIACQNGQNCESSVKEKVQASYANAHIAVIGSFEKVKMPQLSYVSNDMAFMRVSFDIKQLLKGSSDASLLTFRLPIYVPDVARDGPEKYLDIAKNTPEVLKKRDDLEFALEHGDVQQADYIQQLRVNRNAIVTEGAVLAQNAFLVPVMPGGLHPYRIADVPIHFGSQYVLLLSVSVKGDNKAVFPSNLDIYPVNGRVDIKRIISQ